MIWHTDYRKFDRFSLVDYYGKSTHRIEKIKFLLDIKSHLINASIEEFLNVAILSIRN